MEGDPLKLVGGKEGQTPWDRHFLEPSPGKAGTALWLHL